MEDIKTKNFDYKKRVSGNVTKLGYVMTKLKEIRKEVENKQDKLVDDGEGQNIKTINSTSLLGTGDIVIHGIPGTDDVPAGYVLTFDGSGVKWAAIPTTEEPSEPNP